MLVKFNLPFHRWATLQRRRWRRRRLRCSTHKLLSVCVMCVFLLVLYCTSVNMHECVHACWCRCSLWLHLYACVDRRQSHKVCGWLRVSKNHLHVPHSGLQPVRARHIRSQVRETQVRETAKMKNSIKKAPNTKRARAFCSFWMHHSHRRDKSF